MQIKLAKSAASVRKILDTLNLECKVLELPKSTRTAINAASAIEVRYWANCKVSNISN